MTSISVTLQTVDSDGSDTQHRVTLNCENPPALVAVRQMAFMLCAYGASGHCLPYSRQKLVAEFESVLSNGWPHEWDDAPERNKP